MALESDLGDGRLRASAVPVNQWNLHGEPAVTHQTSWHESTGECSGRPKQRFASVLSELEILNEPSMSNFQL